MPKAAALMLIIAHRGVPGKAPENTLSSFRRAWKEEAGGIETDVHLTADGFILCHHDPELRLNKKKRAAIARVDLKTIRAAETQSDPETRAPLLAEALEIVPPGKRIYIEIKCGPEITPALNEALKQSSLAPGQAVVISFNPAAISAWKQLRPDVRALWLSRYRLERDPSLRAAMPEALVGGAQAIQADGVSLKAQSAVDKALVRRIKENGLEAHVWTVDSLREARRYRDMGLDSLTTNTPGKILRGL